MKKARRNERDLILTDAVVCALLNAEADKSGVTLEEYVDKFLKVFYKNPQMFYSILKERH